MATVSENNQTTHQIPSADIKPDEFMISWLLHRFEALSSESIKDLVSLIEMYTNSKTSPEERFEIYETIREIILPHLIGEARRGNLGQNEQIPGKLDRHTNWIGQRVKNLRKEKGWSQEELSKKSKLRQPQISRLEAGVHSPSFKTLEKIANALGVTVGDLDPSN